MGFRNAMTPSQVLPKLFACGGWAPSWSSLAFTGEGVGTGRPEVAPGGGGFWQQVGRDRSLGEGR